MGIDLLLKIYPGFILRRAPKYTVARGIMATQ